MEHASWIPGQARNWTERQENVQWTYLANVPAGGLDSWKAGWLQTLRLSAVAPSHLPSTQGRSHSQYVHTKPHRAQPESPRLSFKIIGQRPNPLSCSIGGSQAPRFRSAATRSWQAGFAQQKCLKKVKRVFFFATFFWTGKRKLRTISGNAKKNIKQSLLRTKAVSKAVQSRTKGGIKAVLVRYNAVQPMRSNCSSLIFFKRIATKNPVLSRGFSRH